MGDIDDGQLEGDPAVQSLSSYIGVDGDNATLNSGRLLINLKPHGERDVSASEVISRLQPQVDRLVGIRLFMQPVQDLTIEDRVSRTQYQFSMSSPDSELLSQWSGRLVEALAQRPELTDVASDLQDKGLQVYLVIDRDAASRLGVSVQNITDALYDAFGQRQINEFQTQINQYNVILELDTKQRGKAESLNYFYLRSPLSNEMVPLSAVAHVAPPSTGPEMVAPRMIMLLAALNCFCHSDSSSTRALRRCSSASTDWLA